MRFLLSWLPQGVSSAQHVSDVVNIAIGLNLLLPVASSFLKSLLDGVEIDPEKIVARHFKGKDASSNELTEIAVAAQAIEEERAKRIPLAWGWWIADAVAALTGIFLLLTGWVDHVGLWCLILFLPIVIAIACSVCKFINLKSRFQDVVDKASRQAESREKSNSAYVRSYTDKCNRALKKLNRSRTKLVTK